MMEQVLDPTVVVRGREKDRSLAIAFAVMVVFFAIGPFIFYPVFLMKALCFALFACAFNLLIGYVGLASFGHALFFGWASYLAAYVAKNGTLSFPVWFGKVTWLAVALPAQSPAVAVLVGTVTAAILGYVAGAIAIRRQGIYFAMITLALAQMMYFFALQAKFTGGEDGIQGVPRGRLFGIFDLSSEMTMYFFIFVVVIAGFLFIYRIINSPFGEVLKAIRENEQRAISLGYRTEHYKLVAFVLSAALAGLAGSLNALVFQLASLTDVHWAMSGDVLLMTLLGGLGTVFGPVVGAFVVIAMQNYLAPFGQWVLVMQGAIFVFCVLLFRRGIVGELAHLLRVQL
jgi:branched-chain amino acid transport system permease protein